MGVADNVIRDAPENGPLDPVAAARAHDHEIDMLGLRGLDDGGTGISLPDQEGDVDAGAVTPDHQGLRGPLASGAALVHALGKWLQRVLPGAVDDADDEQVGLEAASKVEGLVGSAIRGRREVGREQDAAEPLLIRASSRHGVGEDMHGAHRIWQISAVEPAAAAAATTGDAVDGVAPRAGRRRWAAGMAGRSWRDLRGARERDKVTSGPKLGGHGAR